MCAPDPPDPVQTAQAQAGMNIDTAIAQQGVNMIDQFGPTGSTTYGATGDNFTFTDSQGRTVSIPRYQQTTAFTPEQQAIFDAGQGAQLNLAELAQDQSGFLQDYMASPFTFDNQDAANWAYDLGAERLDPRFARADEDMRTRLKNQGIAEGSEAWKAEMERLGQERNDAYNNLMLTGRSQAFSEALAGRNQPINEINALRSSSQVSNPAANFGGATPQAGVGGVDYTGLVSDQYQAQMKNHGAMMGGLFGTAGELGAAAMPFMLSDENAKDDMERIGETDNGLPIYSYTYKGDDTPQIGLKAQDVLKKEPGAVKKIAGLLHVDYSKALEA